MEEDHISQEIAAAFNAGYILQKHEQEILEKVLELQDLENAYMEALAKGKEAREREKIQERQQAIKERSQQKKHTM